MTSYMSLERQLYLLFATSYSCLHLKKGVAREEIRLIDKEIVRTIYIEEATIRRFTGFAKALT